MSLPVPETTPEVDRAERINRWLLRAIGVGIVLIVLGGVVSLYLTGKQTAKQTTIEQAVRVILLSNERADCRTAYSSDRNTILEHANALERRNVAAVVGYQLSEGVTTADLISNKAELDAVNAEAAKLPTLNDMVDHGYTLGGVHHPPCPMVR